MCWWFFSFLLITLVFSWSGHLCAMPGLQEERDLHRGGWPAGAVQHGAAGGRLPAAAHQWQPGVPDAVARRARRLHIRWRRRWRGQGRILDAVHLRRRLVLQHGRRRRGEHILCGPGQLRTKLWFAQRCCRWKQNHLITIFSFLFLWSRCYCWLAINNHRERVYKV